MEMDVKKVIVFFILRQLGLIVFILGLGEVEFVFMYFVCYVFFKVGIFFSVGFLISYNFGNQYFVNFRRLEVVIFFLVVLSLFLGSVFLVGILGIVGYVFKELIVVFLYNIIFWLVFVLLFCRVVFMIVYLFCIILGLINVVKIGVCDFIGFCEEIKLFFFGFILIGFGFVGGDLVIVCLINSCYFEVVLFREV